MENHHIERWPITGHLAIDTFLWTLFNIPFFVLSYQLLHVVETGQALASFLSAMVFLLVAIPGFLYFVQWLLHIAKLASEIIHRRRHTPSPPPHPRSRHRKTDPSTRPASDDEHQRRIRHGRP